MVLLEHGPQVGQRLAALVQQRKHALADADVANQPQVPDNERALRASTQKVLSLVRGHADEASA